MVDFINMPNLIYTENLQKWPKDIKSFKTSTSIGNQESVPKAILRTS